MNYSTCVLCVACLLKIHLLIGIMEIAKVTCFGSFCVVLRDFMNV